LQRAMRTWGKKTPSDIIRSITILRSPRIRGKRKGVYKGGKRNGVRESGRLGWWGTFYRHQNKGKSTKRLVVGGGGRGGGRKVEAIIRGVIIHGLSGG